MPWAIYGAKRSSAETPRERSTECCWRSEMIEEMSMGPSSEAQNSTRLYRRELPGAGYVVIDLTHAPDGSAADRTDREAPRIRLYVERRADEERRAGHNPPVVAEFAGDQRAPEVGELYRM